MEASTVSSKLRNPVQVDVLLVVWSRRLGDGSEPPSTTDVGPIADHVRGLLAGGMSGAERAAVAVIDRTTISTGCDGHPPSTTTPQRHFRILR